MEELGPTFIKIGQVLASRPDLVPSEVIAELEKLQDQVAPLPFNDLKPIIENSLGRKLEDAFASLDPIALASASIAQVHAARTMDGDDVVIKIKKPGVEKTLTQDLEILELIASLAERYVPEARPFKPTRIATEFKKALLTEVDFTREASNLERFRENFASSHFLVVPRHYKDLSTTQILTIERLRGVKLVDVEAVRALGVDPTELLRQGMDSFFQSMLVDGLFHADPHGGNILVLPDGRMGLLDFGSVGWLSKKSKAAVVDMFLALVTEDYDALVFEYLRLSSPTPGSRSSTNIAEIQREVAALFAPYYGLPLREIPAGRLLMDGANIAFRHHVALPQDLVMVFKTIMILEGIGRTLDPDFDLLGAASKYAKIVLKERYSPKEIAKETLFVGRDLLRFVQNAPRQWAEVLRQIESGELKVNLEIKNLDRYARAQALGSQRISQAILAIGLLGAASFASSTHNVPIWGQISLWVAAGFFVVVSIIRSFG
jgi:ubiquinone biosynthesis protein